MAVVLILCFNMLRQVCLHIILRKHEANRFKELATISCNDRITVKYIMARFLQCWYSNIFLLQMYLFMKDSRVGATRNSSDIVRNAACCNVVQWCQALF